MPTIELDDIFDIMDEIVDSPEQDGWEAFIQLREKLAEKAAQHDGQQTGGNVCQFCGLPCGDKPYHILCDPLPSHS